MYCGASKQKQAKASSKTLFLDKYSRVVGPLVACTVFVTVFVGVFGGVVVANVFLPFSLRFRYVFVRFPRSSRRPPSSPSSARSSPLTVFLQFSFRFFTVFVQPFFYRFRMYNVGLKTVKKLPNMIPDENCKKTPWSFSWNTKF